jgi:hypothetical protein
MLTIALGACMFAFPLAGTTRELPTPRVPALERYASGDFEGAIATITAGSELRAAIRGFRADADRWIADGPEPDRRWRSDLVATVAVDLVGRALDGTYDAADYRDSLRPLVEWTCRRLRSHPPSEFERLFHVATIGLLQGAHDQELLIGLKLAFSPYDEPPQQHILHGGQRFPQEGRFKLAWAAERSETYLIASGPVAPSALVRQGYGLGRFEADGTGAERALRETADILASLMNDPGVGLEARLRRSVMLVLMGQPEEVVGDFEQLMRSPDGFVRYLAHMMRGVIHDRAGQLPEATFQYRRATEVVPAPTAMTSLAAALYRQGQTAEAATVVAAAERNLDVTDPWLTYGDRDYRLFPDVLARMRASVTR